MGLLHCKNIYISLFVSLVCGGVWFLFSGLLTLLFSLFYVTCEFQRLLHIDRESANKKKTQEYWKELWSCQHGQPKPGSQRHFSHFYCNHHDIIASQTNHSRDYNNLKDAFHQEPRPIHNKLSRQRRFLLFHSKPEKAFKACSQGLQCSWSLQGGKQS